MKKKKSSLILASFGANAGEVTIFMIGFAYEYYNYLYSGGVKE